MRGLWGMGRMMFTKYLVVVDESLRTATMWTCTTPAKCCSVCAPTPTRNATASSSKARPTCSTTPPAKSPSAAKLGIDATRKLAREGFKMPCRDSGTLLLVVVASGQRARTTSQLTMPTTATAAIIIACVAFMRSASRTQKAIPITASTGPSGARHRSAWGHRRRN
jgi:3-polyprenyl-4-hydroxybenzoate decarboxylase